MNLAHIFSIACVIVSVALFLAGHAGLAGFICVLATVVELLGAAITGKQGNETER